VSWGDPNRFVHESFGTRVIAGPGVLAGIAVELRALGVTRPLVLSGTRSGRSAAHAEILRLLAPMEPVALTDVPQHASLEQVATGAERARRSGVDGLVALGGGSVSDTAKAIAVALAEGDPVERFATRFVPGEGFVTPPARRSKPPILAVPLTASGAEATPAFGIRAADGAKRLFRDAGVVCRVVLLDPDATREVPSQVLLETGMNGLAHCIEALYARRRSPIATLLAIEGLRRFLAALPALHDAPLDPGCRAAVLVAGHLSGQVLAGTGSCLHHAICHVLGARLGLPHGFVNGVVLPHAVAAVVPDAQAELADACLRLGLGETAAALPPALFALQQRIGVPSRLRERVADRAVLAPLAAQVLHERGMANHPRTVDDPREIAAVLEAAW